MKKSNHYVPLDWRYLFDFPILHSFINNPFFLFFFNLNNTQHNTTQIKLKLKLSSYLLSFLSQSFF